MPAISAIRLTWVRGRLYIVPVTHSWAGKQREIITIGGALMAGVLFLSACSSGAGNTASADLSKYDQTWSKSYSDTTCAEFKTSMTEHERWAAAADILASARTKGDGLGGMPSDALVTTFRQGVETGCVIDTMSVAETGATLYLTERARFGGS